MLISHARDAMPNSAANLLPTSFWGTKFRCGQSRQYQFMPLITLIFLGNRDIFWTLGQIFSLSSGRGRRQARPVDAFLDPLFLEDPEPVDAVEGGPLVAFRERRVIEHRVDEVVDRAAEREHRLTDVDQLARTLADDVDAEQPAGLAMKDQLQEPGYVAEDLAAGDLLVARLADLVGCRGLGQLLLVLADHRDFGDRVDAVGEALGRALRFEPAGVADGWTG